MPADHDLCLSCAHRCPPAASNLDSAPECAIEMERCDVEAWQVGYFAEDAKCPGYAEARVVGVIQMTGLGTGGQPVGEPVPGRAPPPADIALSPDQEAACTAILVAIEQGINPLVLVGPAGTGKTTLVKELVRRLRAASGREVAFAAPTGKAAVRLRESTGEQATTIHSLIYGKPENRGRCPAFREEKGPDPFVLAAETTCREVLADATPSLASLCNAACAAAEAPRLDLVAKVLEHAAACTMLEPVKAALQNARDPARVRALRAEDTPWDDGLPACGKWSHDLAMSRLEMRAKGLTHRACPHCKREFLPDVEIKVKLCFEKKQGKDSVEEMSEDAILVIDEASMVNDTLHGDTLDALPRATILYVGDREQLPPVEGKWGPDFERPTAALTRIHRQALDNPIIAVATKLRTAEEKYPFSKYDNDRAGRFHVGDGSVDTAARWLADRRERGGDATLITYTNNMRRALNARVREYRGLVEACDRRQIPVAAGDRLLVLSNNRVTGHSNGEVFVVEEATWQEPTKLIGPREVVAVKLAGRPETMLVPMVAFGEDRREFMAYVQSHVNAWDNATRADPSGKRARSLNLVDPAKFLHCDFGECLTCHKSQGSQWADVGVVWDRSLWGMWFNDSATGRRWAYTAVTRASETLKVWYVK